MPQKGDIVLVRFPFTNLEDSKLRPVLIFTRCPGDFDDYIVAFISSQMRHYVGGIDIILEPSAGYFKETGLKVASVIKTGKIATISSDVFIGKMGFLNKEIAFNAIEKTIEILRRNSQYPI